MSIVKIHIICRTISKLLYISTEGHITFHLAILQSVALCFMIRNLKKHQILTLISDVFLTERAERQ